MNSFIISIDTSFEMTENFFAHLLKDEFVLNSEIIVATDDIKDIDLISYLNNLRQEFMQIKLIKSNSKIGYGKINNIAVKNSSGEYLFFINTDVFAFDGCFKQMYDVLKNGEATCVQPLLIYPQSNRVQCAGTMFGPYFKKHLFVGNSIEAPIVKMPGRRQALTSALYAMPATVFNKFGGFDEFYFNKLESFELSYKITLDGGICWYLPTAKAYHSQGGSRGRYYFDFYQQEAYFWSRFGNIVKENTDIHKYLAAQITDSICVHTYFAISFSHIRSWPDILKDMPINISDFYEMPWIHPDKINLIDRLPRSIFEYPLPIAFIVENIRNLGNNQAWLHARKQTDIILDTYGNLILAKRL